MYNFEKMLDLFNQRCLNTEQYQKLLDDAKNSKGTINLIDYFFEHIETLLDTSMIQLFNNPEESINQQAELHGVLDQLRPVIISKVYLYLCHSLLEQYPISNLNKLFAHYCNQYSKFALDDVKEDLKRAKSNFYKRVNTYTEPHGFNPYRFPKTPSKELFNDTPKKGFILENLMDYLHESISFNNNKPESVKILIPGLFFIFVQNYSLLPGHGYHKNGFSFDTLESLEGEIKKVLSEKNYATTIKCKFDKLLCETTIDEIFPFARIRNTIDIYLYIHFDFESKKLYDANYSFLSQYPALLYLPTIPLQNYYANNLLTITQSDDKNYSDLIFHLWNKVSNITMVLFPLEISYLSQFLWDIADNLCDSSFTCKQKMNYVKSLLEDYIVENPIDSYISDTEINAKIPSFRTLHRTMIPDSSNKASIESLIKRQEIDIIYELLSPYSSNHRSRISYYPYITGNHAIPFDKLLKKIYASYLPN